MDGQELPTLQPAIDAATLPSSGASELIIVPATAKEHEQCTLINSSQWKGPLTLPQYLERERVLLRQDLTNNSQLTPWILTSRSIPPNYDGTRPILASCETLLKTAYVARGGQIEQILTHGIGSVFTRQEHRGRGYAGRMMVELSKKLENWQQKNDIKGSFSILYSDIGQKFYDKFGWKPYPSTHIHLEPFDEAQYQQMRGHLNQTMQKKTPEIEDLNSEDVKTIPTIAWLEDSLKAESLADSSVPLVAVRPDMQHFMWHWTREEVMAAAIGKPTPTVKGAVHRPSGMALIWARVYDADARKNSLHVLHVAVPPQLKAGPLPADRVALAALLLRAQLEAHVSGMHDGVEVWDPPGFVITAAQQLRQREQGSVQVVRRDKEHVCSLKWIGKRPTDNPSGNIVWVNNEKYAWC